MFAIFALIALAGAALAFSGPKTAATANASRTASPIQLPANSVPAGLPGAGTTQTVQNVTSKIQYFLTSWQPVPQGATGALKPFIGQSFSIANAINDPMGSWVSYWMNPASGRTTLFARSNPNTQAAIDFKLI